MRHEFSLSTQPDAVGKRRWPVLTRWYSLLGRCDQPVAPANAVDETMGSVDTDIQLLGRNFYSSSVRLLSLPTRWMQVEESGSWRVLDTIADGAEKKEEGSGRAR